MMMIESIYITTVRQNIHKKYNRYHAYLYAISVLFSFLRTLLQTLGSIIQIKILKKDSYTMLSSKRVKWIIQTVSDSLRIRDTYVEDQIKDRNRELLERFLEGEGPPKIFFNYQVIDNQGNDDMKDNNQEPTLFINYGDPEKLKEKAVWFIRMLPEHRKTVNLQEVSDNEVIWGEISPLCVSQLNNLMENVYYPLIFNLEDKEWKECDEECKREFLSHTKKFQQEVQEAMKLMSPGQELFKLEAEDAARFNNSANDTEKIPFFERKFQQWLQTINNLLNDDSDQRREPIDAGPDMELEYWRTRMQKITNWSEQLKSKDFQWVKMTLQRHKQHEGQRARGDEHINKLMMDYNRLDLLLTDKLNEAKDNVKYLSTLEKFLEPLYKGTPQQIIDTLPALMNAIKMIHTIARFYNTNDKMTGLFVKITNQMIKNCKEKILAGGKIDDVWRRDPAELIEVLGQCIKLNREYKDCYKDTKEKVADMPKGKTFDFPETQLFGKFDTFVRRLQKLIDIFSNIQQFQALAKHNLEGMESLTTKFKDIIEDFKKKRHDLLDTNNNKFDRDWVEFNVEISHLDVALQNFIDNNFNRFRNIEYSLKLLRKFESTIKRDSLRHNLTSKYNAILHNYATELDSIQRVFTDQKPNPPTVRNMPVEAGKIIWARHLFQKITGPINMFPENVINSTEIKKYYGGYNTLGKQLTIYEMWYFQNWQSEIERSKAALQATLIVRHDENKKLYVNFDLEIMQLIREAKCLDRQGIEIPESARIILLQEEKFKMYYNELLYVLKEYERIISKIKPICKTLIGPHVEDLELKLRPGMVTLTWTSMNIDSYLHNVHAGLNKLEQLIITVNDIIENRIENNLKNISKVLLVHLPQESKPLTLDQFVNIQEEYIRSKTDFLMSKNVEVERAVDDLLQVILQYQLDPHVDPVLSEETKRIKRYYFWYLYQALLNSTQNSLNAMKYRVCGKKGPGQSSTGNLKPFFEVDVQLQSNDVRLNPSLDEIQKAINRAATAVLRCSKNLYNWDQQEKEVEKKASFYEMIAQDKEIVKVILLLTGSIQGTRNKVHEFLSSFKKFSWLWTENISDNIKSFSKKNPSLQDYEDALKRFSNIEEDIEKIETSHKIGAMELKTANLCQGLRQHAKDWKAQYSQDLHKRARSMLDQLTEQTKTLSTKLSKEVKDIDSLGYVMETLEDIRKLQAEIDMKFNPVQDMYGLLDNYLPGGITDKDEMDSRSMLKRNWDALIQQAEIKGKELQLKQKNYLKQLKKSIKDFVKDVQDFRKDYEVSGPMVDNITPKEAIERLRRFEDEYSVKYKFFQINRKGEDLFGLQNQKYPELDKTEAELKNLKKLYSLYSDVIETINNWKEEAWADITIEGLRQMEENIQKYGDQCVRLPKDLKEWTAYKELKQEIDNLKDVLPIIVDLKKPSIKPRHWQKICETTKKTLNYENPDNFFISELISANLLQFLEDILDVTESADKQLKIESQLNEINQIWDVAEFQFSVWGKRETPCMLNGLSVQTVTERLEEDSMTLATLNAQRYVAPFKPAVEQTIRIFSDVSETLDMWIKVQKLWTSLEPVFMGGDIARQMPLQAKQFLAIDKNWTRIMEKAFEAKKVISCCQNDMLKDFLPDLQKKLEECQKMLEAYLEGKRKKFPRFYFVSNPTLLKILSQGSEPTSIQEDFEKLFDAVTRVTFDKNPEKKGTNEKVIKAIMQVSGKDEEAVTLNQVVKCEGNIEGWLKQLEVTMQNTLRDIARQASAQCFQLSLRDFARAYCSQIALLGIQIIWTFKITEALEKTGRNENKNIMEQKRAEIREMMLVLSGMCLENIPSTLDRTKVETLVTIHVHQRDIAQELKCKDVNDFEWQKQTRLYWRTEQDNCVISITDWDQAYSYEFLGSKERLCITPLTDRCYITLAQALSMNYGGAPAGPAGTGKTETVKDLGRTLGVFVVVTNCSDQHRYKDMAKIFKGLCQSGLWGCFDEFNRIDLEVLSVVAMQVESITMAKKQHLKEFMFPEEPNPIELVPSVAYFITMNPGYAGRQELPENLKALFRGVSMMVPDREIIMKVKLASVGYNAIDVLGKKFNVLYKLCEEQLSKQRHYDFGLRNILSVLRTAGNTKREETKSDEEMLLMRSLRDMNLSKLVADDIPLFNGLLLDIFPRQTEVPKKLYPDVEKKIPEIIDKKGGLVKSDPFTLKIIQLYETALVRHGFMLVGPTGAGKSTIMTILTDCLSELGQPHRIQRMNPKAITAQEMYGVKSEISDDWIPGIFSTLWQKSNVRGAKFNTWITCDGPVDAIWIENLNTVLDDNKILTLANGERIPMTENCKLVFEVENLNNASPATVSRCGQVYISPTDLGYEAVYKGWILARKQDGRGDEAEKLGNLLNKYFNQMKIMESIDKICKTPVMEVSHVIKVTETLNLLNGILRPLVSSNKTLTESDYEKVVVYSLTWAVGGIFEAQDRQYFHEYLWTKGAPIPQKGKENETVFDYYVYVDEKGSCEWRICTPDEWKPPEKFQFSQLLMPTIDSFRAELLMSFILYQPKTAICNNAVLLVGGSGTAKTSSVLMFANKFNKDKMLFKRINFSSATQPSMFQATIEAECDFKIGKDFAPPQNKMMTVFIDDMSMPFVNKWGDQITLEIVRQQIETGGFYMLDKAQRGNFKNIKNLIYVGAMQHPGGGRNDIPNRLKRQHMIFNMILPLSVEGIYGPIIKHQFKVKYFSTEVNKTIEGLTNATIMLWNKVKNTMLPTPAKFHYVFNMRDLSRIFKGILQIKKETINTCSAVGNVMKPEVFLVGLWMHECERVFSDKMTNQKDKDQVMGYIKDISLEAFSSLEAEIIDKFSKDKLFLFCDFLREDIKNEDGIIEVEAEKVYEAINQMDKLKQRCYSLLNDYNNKYVAKKMNLVLFDDAIRHLLRISRIVKMNRSNALLVGVGGSGKQSLTRLSAEIGRHICYQIVLTKNFGEKDLKEEIKKLFDWSGHMGKHVTFILTDSEVKKEEFLEYINMILSTGEIAGLLAKDEKEVWMADVRNDYVKEKQLGNVDPPQSDLYLYFVDRLRDNLHIVLCFSPVGQKFRDRSRKFPALFNECTIDWFLPWPEEALVSVAETFIKNFKELDTKSETKVELMRHMGNVHLIVNNICDIYFQKMRRQVYVTPKSFLSYLNSYKELYITKYAELDVQERSYKIGLGKIQEATISIGKMEVGLKDEEAQLKEASEKTERLLEDLEKESKKAKQKNDEVEATTAQCKKQADMIAVEKDAAMKDLEAALPALRRAQEAVDSIDPKDIVELKGNNKPLDIIKYIMDSVLVFFQQKLVPITIEQRIFNRKEGTLVPFLKESWEESGRPTLIDMQFLKRLQTYEKDQINEETIELLQPYIMQQNDWFNEKTASNASKAANGILKWALAIYEYHEKSKIVKPKRVYLQIQEGRLQVAMNELRKAQTELEQIKAYLAQLKETFSKQIEEKNQLEIRSNKTKKKINTARQLISSLSGEKDRWGKGASEIAEQKRRLVGNVSLATAFISYCGPFNSEFRNLLTQDQFVGDMKKRGVPVTPGLELTGFLVDDATIGEWNLQGLPKDELSIQNGIMVTNSTRYPLLIDPQGQGNFWIRNKYAEQIDPVRCITTLNHPKFKDMFLKICMDEGKCLIIENIENEVDPMLDPVLEKQVQTRGKTVFIDIGGTPFDFDDKFRMFLFCRLANPSFSPELSAKTTIIDFTVTQGGLEQQLLGKVISKEQKALEDSLNQLLTDVNQNKKDLQRLDKNLLDRLTQSQGNLLDDEDLITVLASTKTQAQEVSVKLADAEIKTKEINEKREQYRPVAIRGSALYFTILEVALVNWMYNSSLEQFLMLFNQSIDWSERVTLPAKRVDNIIKFLTFHVYRYVNRGLFEKDKITFILMMCFKILQTANKINSNDVSILLKSGAALDIRTERAKPFSFLQDKTWLNILALSRHHFSGDPLAFFRELPDSISRNEGQWKQWIERNDPENFAIPDFAERITTEKDIGSFISLCLVRSLREDRTLVAATQFINAAVGKEFTAPISYPIDSIWQESSKLDPVLFLLSAGADPTSAIDDLAKKKKKFPCEKVSMGEGQEEVARKAIRQGFEAGGWVILQNCHLGLKFMEEIETIVVPDAVIHEDFRLWITCEQHPKFPLGLLQKTIKVTNEPPKGLKAGLYKTFTTIITQEFLDKVDHSNWRSLIFTVCFLHSIVIERRKFGPLGWCIPYEFNNPDLEASLAFVEKYLTTILGGPPSQSPNLNLNMSVIRYMVCEVQYGGRITDDLDRELFNAYGEDYLKETIFGNEHYFAEITNEGSGGGQVRERFRYRIPPTNAISEIQKYHEYIVTIPGVDNPEVFGLHVNADITFRLKESLEMINTIMDTRPKESNVGGGKTREEIVQEKARDLLMKLPPDYVDLEVREMVKKLPGPKQLGDKGLTVPLNIFLYQEIARMQRIIGIGRKTLMDVIDAIDGQIIMTPDILDAINAMFDAKVPNAWVYDATGVEISWILPTLGAWFGSLIDRNKQLNDWLKNNRPQAYWLTGFFNPQGFLTAMKQEVTRMHKARPGDKVQESWSLDDVTYSTQVKEREYENIKDIQQEGVYIHGLFLEGCRWSRNGLDESEPKKMFAPLPILYVTAINKKKSNEAEKNSSLYSCPVYKYPRRTDKYLIFRVGLPCEGTGSHRWKLRGVALLCSTE